VKTKRLFSGPLGTVLEYAVSITLFVLVWQIYVTAAKVPAFVLPVPGKVFSQLVKLFASGEIWPHLWTTTSEVVVGFLLGTLLGIVLGYVFVKVDFVKTMLMPYLVFAQTSPKIALVPLFVVWFGIGMVSKVILIISMVVFPVMMGMVLGIESIPKDFMNLMKVLKASRWQLFREVEMPYSLPMLFSGLKNGIVQAVIGAIVSEWISGKQGLGYILTYASSVYNTPMLLAGIIVTIVVGIVSYQIIAALENRLLYWHESKSPSLK